MRATRVQRHRVDYERVTVLTLENGQRDDSRVLLFETVRLLVGQWTAGSKLSTVSRCTPGRENVSGDTVVQRADTTTSESVCSN